MGNKRARKNSKEIECDSEEAETANRVTNARIGSSQIECDSNQDQTENQVNKSRKGAVNRKKSGEWDEEEVSSGKPYRAGFSAMRELVSVMNAKSLKLSEEQLDVLMESPFGDLYIMFLENNYGYSDWNKSDKAFTKFLRCIKGATKHEIVFEFVRKGEKHIITSTPQELGLILGVPCIEGRKRATKEAMRGGCFRESEFYRRIFGKAKTATKALIREAIFRLVEANGANEKEPSIRRRDNEDLAMLIGLYMCNTIFFTTKDAISIKEKYLGLVDNFERCKTLSWAHLIHAHLAKRINKSFKNPENITGCVFYLPIWFAEHTQIVVPKPLPEDRFVPRAGRWNLKNICNELLKDMDESKYVFHQKFVDPYTEKEKVVLNTSEESGIIFLEEGREDKYEKLRMTIKSSWEQMQEMDCNNGEVVPKMQEMLNKIYFKAYPEIQPDTIHKQYDDSIQMDDDAKVDVPMSHQEAPEDGTNSVQVIIDKRVEFDDSVQLDDDAKVDLPMSHQEAPEDDSNSVQVINDKRVEVFFDDDVGNIDAANILIGLKETPRLETSATAINPEPTPIVTETTFSPPIAPEAKVADQSQEENHTAPETTSSASPKPASEDPNVTVPIVTETTSSPPIDPEAKVADQSQEENHTAPETTNSASPKPPSEDPNVTVPEAKLGDTKPFLVFQRNFKKRKASESNVQKDDILAENKKAKDEYVTAGSAEFIQKLEEDGLYKGINSMDGNGKTSLEEITRESGKTIEKLQEDGESEPSTAKSDEFALATTRNRNNIQVEASSVVTKEKETLSSELRGMNHPERVSNAALGKKQILLILDLNGVLGSFGSRKQNELRPHCHEFVRFCVASFKKVVFWSSMTSVNTTKAMEKIFPPDLDIQQIQIWNQDHCTLTELRYPDPCKASKPWFLKVTHQINTRFPREFDHAINTIMVDDSPIKTVINPRNAAVFPDTWHPWKKKDKALSEGGAIRMFLDSLPCDGHIQHHVLNKQPKCFRQGEANRTITMVWRNSEYVPTLRKLEEREISKPGSTTTEGKKGRI